MNKAAGPKKNKAEQDASAEASKQARNFSIMNKKFPTSFLCSRFLDPRKESNYSNVVEIYSGKFCPGKCGIALTTLAQKIQSQAGGEPSLKLTLKVVKKYVCRDFRHLIAYIEVFGKFPLLTTTYFDYSELPILSHLFFEIERKRRQKNTLRRINKWLKKRIKRIRRENHR